MIVEISIGIFLDCNAFIIRIEGVYDQTVPVVDGYLCQFFVRKVNETFKVKHFQLVFNEFLQRTILALIYNDTFDISVQGEVYQVDIDLDRDFRICNGSMANANFAHILKIRSLTILALTEVRNQSHGFFHGCFHATLDMRIHDDGSPQ